MIYSITILNNKIDELNIEKLRIETLTIQFKRENILNKHIQQSRAIRVINKRLKDLKNTVALMEEAIVINQ